MSQSITINSINYDGELATILFKPADENLVINLGTNLLPFEFFPGLLDPPKTAYGSYTILVDGADCPYVMNVPKPTPTPTPTNSPTRTQTPTPTTTQTPTATLDPCKLPTPTPTTTVTPTVTPTPTPTPSVTCTNPCGCKPGKPTRTPTPTKTSTPTVTPTLTPTPTTVYYAYLFIEPISGSTNIGQWMYDGGSNFYGFGNTSQPTQSATTFNIDMNRYVDFTGWTSGQFPPVISQTVPQVNGGVDSFGNAKVAYNFLTTKVPENTISGDAWYTWIIPISLTNNEKQTVIDLNISNNPNLFTQVATEGTINTYTFTYSGSTIPKTTYRVYTTFPNTIFQINDSQNIYFRGNSISP